MKMLVISWKKWWYGLLLVYLISSVVVPIAIGMDVDDGVMVVLNIPILVLRGVFFWMVLSGIVNVFRNRGLGRLGMAGATLLVVFVGIVLSNVVYSMINPALR